MTRADARRPARAAADDRGELAARHALEVEHGQRRLQRNTIPLERMHDRRASNSADSRIFAELELLERVQLAQRRRKLGQPAVVEQELLQRVQAAEVLWDRAELVAGQVEDPQLRELADLLEGRRHVHVERLVQHEA